MTSSPVSDPKLPTNRLSREFIEFLDARRSQGKPLALIAVLATEGSTYSKAGQLVLVDTEGRLAGLVSGGCLESDLARRAARAIESNERAFVDYDLRNEDDVFGLGVGCDGSICLLIEPLSPANRYEPLASSVADLASSLRSVMTLPAAEAAGATPLRIELFRPANVLLLGAGPDAPPLLQMIDALGWQVSVTDHRAHYIDVLRRPEAATVRCCPADEIADVVELDGFDAAIVMSHNLATDRAYLEVLAASTIGFIGLLGPRHRRDRLLGELSEETAALLEQRLRAPVGRPIGGRGPAAIALEIVVELQEHVCSLEAD
jgi:xanthine/CO dehydrogenase XdhC/CoxF family maturation factor